MVDDDTNMADNKKVLQSVQHELAALGDNHFLSLTDVLNKADVNYDAYIAALAIAHKGPNIILRCDMSDIFLNAYNPHVLHLWGGISTFNMSSMKLQQLCMFAVT